MTLHLMRGPSASGKTTFAKTLDAVRVSRDEIRRQLTGDPGKFSGDSQFEAKVTKIETEQVRDLLIARKNVVVDDTNLIDRFARNWLDMAYDYGHDYEVHVFTATLVDLWERNAARELNEQVPMHVINSQYERSQKMGVVMPLHPFVDWTPVAYDSEWENVVTCDLDGTLLIAPEGFSPYDPNHYPLDSLNPSVDIALGAVNDAGYAVKFLSGRGEEYREATQNRLWDFAWSGDLFLRKAGDKRRDDVVKVEMFNENIRGKYNVVAHFDDRDRVVRALRAIGLPVFQTSEGNF